jgi:hypothetical protein
MDFLVYTAKPLDDNATLDSFEQGADKDISRMNNLIKNMDLKRVLNNQTVDLLVDELEYDKESDIVTADIYKQTSPGKALHELAEDGNGMTVQEIISEHDNAFVQGVFGMEKVDSEIYLIIESNFGSFFVDACKGMDITPQYSSDTIQSIQESETIGETTLDFADDYDLTASLFKLPEDEDIRKEKGLGKTNVLNELASLFKISRAHRMSLDIDRDEWLANIDVFDKLIEHGIVTTVRIEDTKNGIVKLGEGGERAIRKKIKASSSGKRAVEEAFINFPE